jgi:hypothetical protein
MNNLTSVLSCQGKYKQVERDASDEIFGEYGTMQIHGEAERNQALSAFIFRAL